MSFLSNAHTHTDYCDGVSAIDETLAQARRLGFVSLGFSGHACLGFDPAYSMSPAAQQAYFARLRALQAQSAPPRIWACGWCFTPGPISGCRPQSIVRRNG